MRKIKEILRLKWLEGRRHRHIARALEVSVGKVSAVVQRAAEVGLEWERVEQLGEAELEAAIYGAVRRKLKAPLPDRADGTYARLLSRLARIDVLVIDSC